MSFQLNRGLEPLTKSTTFKYCTWDIEANNWWDLVLIGMWDGSEYYHFRTVSEFFEFLFQQRYNGRRFFAHFGGRYDFNFIFDFIRKWEKKIACSFYCSGSLVIQITLRYKNITIKLCDSYRLFYMPASSDVAKTDNKSGLRALGKVFNVLHQKTDLDFSEVRYDRETILYNEQDCRCLYEVMERFFEETGIMSETFATHALRIWRKDFLKQTIWKPPNEVSEFIRKSYHGGRVEVYKRGSENLHAYDVNSMYPFVMQFPVPVRYQGQNRQLLHNSKDYGFVEATIDVPDNYIPTLPVRLDKLYFPFGTIRGVWTSEELIAAENRGCKIQKIHQAYYFESEKLFEGYVKRLYELKKKATSEATRLIAKGLLNALYGKFGQDPTKKIFCLEDQAPSGAIPILEPSGIPSGFAYYERTSHSAYLLPHLAAAVTSKARLHLLSRLGEDTYYCDTDSVFTSKVYPTSKELGDWGSIGDGEAMFIQPKLYKWKGNWKSKGLGKDQDIDAFIAGNPNMVRRAKSIKEALRDGTEACGHVTIEKYLRETRPKRAWINKEDTRPWDVKELER
jgi:DNA polymerase type B, organellar and viral